MRCRLLCVTALVLACLLPATVFAQARGWEKLSGQPVNYSGVPDGLDPAGDRHNSYSWCMEMLDGKLYVGDIRDVLGTIVGALGTDLTAAPDIPIPSQDARARIYQYDPATKVWKQFYISPTSPFDAGYRMMLTFPSTGANKVLYVGTASFPGAGLLAITPNGNVQRVQTITGNLPGLNSVRTIREYNGKMVWGSTDQNGLAIWYSSNPLGDYNNNIPYGRLSIPNWFSNRCTTTTDDEGNTRTVCGAEIFDIASYNGWMYVVFLNYDRDTMPGFWMAKIKQNPDGSWTPWQLVVGDKALGAKYPAGMGRNVNIGGTPVVFKGKLYIGTLIGDVFWLAVGINPSFSSPNFFGGTKGVEIYRFDTTDKAQRVMPPAFITNPTQSDLVSGFINPFNKYIWRFGIQDGTLYAGTLDLGIAFDVIGRSLATLPLPSIATEGFDVYSTTDGVIWLPVTLNGMGDRFNYGARSFFTDPNTGDLYLGTANPFYGGQVWRKKSAVRPSTAP